MKPLIVVVAFVLLAFQPAIGQERHAPSLSDGRAMRSGELHEAMIRAMDGDAEIAQRIAMHFTAPGVQDVVSQRRWTQIAAENGNLAAQYNMWSFVRDSRDPLEQARGIYWLRRAAEDGDSTAVKALKEIESRLAP